MVYLLRADAMISHCHQLLNTILTLSSISTLCRHTLPMYYDWSTKKCCLSSTEALISHLICFLIKCSHLEMYLPYVVTLYKLSRIIERCCLLSAEAIISHSHRFLDTRLALYNNLTMSSYSSNVLS